MGKPQGYYLGESQLKQALAIDVFAASAIYGAFLNTTSPRVYPWAGLIETDCPVRTQSPPRGKPSSPAAQG